MLQVLEDNFHPSSISNSFTTLLAPFNDTQGLWVLPPRQVRSVVLRLSRLRQLHRRPSSLRRRRPRVLHLPRLDLRPRWRRVMRAPRIAFTGMGMTRGRILNLMGLFLCTHRLLSIRSVPFFHLPFHLRRPVLGCPWSWTHRPCWMWTIHRMISFSLRDLCLRCTGLSPLRSFGGTSTGHGGY